MNVLTIDKEPDERPSNGYQHRAPHADDEAGDCDSLDQELVDLLLAGAEEGDRCAGLLDQQERDEQLRSEFLDYVARLRGGARAIRICSGISTQMGGWSQTGDRLLRYPCVRERKSVLADSCDYLGFDALEVRLADVFLPQGLHQWLPWAGPLVRIANIREPHSGPTSRYFATVDLHPSPTSFEGKLWVVLKAADGSMAQVQLGARSSIGELTGFPMPPSWEGVNVGMFLGNVPFSLASMPGRDSPLSFSSEEGYYQWAAPVETLPT
jgi:hypothetical protein